MIESIIGGVLISLVFIVFAKLVILSRIDEDLRWRRVERTRLEKEIIHLKRCRNELLPEVGKLRQMEKEIKTRIKIMTEEHGLTSNCDHKDIDYCSTYEMKESDMYCKTCGKEGSREELSSKEE